MLLIIAISTALGKFLDWCDYQPSGAEAFVWCFIWLASAARLNTWGVMGMLIASDPALSAYVSLLE